jgi:hypothetical protein
MPNPVSWSELSTWEASREDWEKKYIWGLKEPPNFPMQRGTDIHHMIATGNRDVEKSRYTPDEIRVHDKIMQEFKTLIPYSLIFEKEVVTEIDGIPIKGFWDGWAPEDFILVEIKTGALWTEERVKDHGQLILYSLQAVHQEGVLPIVKLFTASTQNGKCKVMQHESSVEQMEGMKGRLRTFRDWCVTEKLWDKRLSSRETITV